MNQLRDNLFRPWGLAGISIVVLLLAIGLVGVVGVIENERVEDTAQHAIVFDVEIEDNGDDVQVAVLNLRHYHRNIALGGPTPAAIEQFDDAYDELLEEIADLERIDGIETLDIPQPAYLRELAALYYTQFRAAIPLFPVDGGIEFKRASDVGLERIAELEEAAEAIDDLGEALTEQSLSRVQSATTRERIVLVTLLSGVALVGVVLAVIAGRVVDRLRIANLQEHQSSQRLAEALRTQSDFIADASHELRTPLTLIRGNAEIELEARGDVDRQQLLGEILSESIRMGRLVDDLLFLARSDAGTAPIEREFLPIRVLLNRLRQPAEALARHREASLKFDLDEEGYVEADQGRIEQAVLILVDNAIKFSSSEECVELSASVGSGHLTLQVTDRGPGIAAEELPRLFDRFYQVGPHRTRRRGGSGLGLAIAKSIVDAHNGKIAIESEIGVGTTVSIHLPLAGLQ